MNGTGQIKLALNVLLVATVAIAACAKKEAARTDSAGGATMRADSTAAASAATAPAAPGAAPAYVDSIGTYGEDLYDAVKAGKWADAQKLVDQLASVSKTANVPDLTGLVDSLKQAVAAKQKQRALEESNRVTYIAAEMTRKYTSTTPVEVLLLDYYGRELEVWSAAKNTAKLKETADAIRKSWDAVRPAVAAHNGTKQAEATDAIVKKIEAAKTPAQYAAVAKPLLDEVDELEKVFTHQ